MTGPEHYQRAEVAQDAAAAIQALRTPGPEVSATEALLDALVHATLALAAATALAGVSLNLPESSDVAREWNQAILPEVTP